MFFYQIKGQFTSFGSSFITIQGRHKVTETEWYYNDGSVITFFTWAQGQPDVTKYQSFETLALSVRDDFLMHDTWSGHKGPFLCEKLI